MPYLPTWKERLEEAKQHVLPAVAGLIVLGLVGWLVWHEKRPQGESKPDAVAKEPAALLAARQQATGEVVVLEKTYRRAVESGAVEAVLAAQLDRVIAKQQELIRLEPQVRTEQAARLAGLEAERSVLRARTAAARSVGLEREALEQGGSSAVVVEKLREALRLQHEANANTPATGARDIQREARLTQAIETAQAEPLREALEVALTLARAATADGRWEDAIKAYGEARVAQAGLNQRFPATRFADVAALGRIDTEVVSLKATGAAAIIAAREREGDAAAAAARAQEAAVAYAAAADLQADVNERFARSRFVSVARVEELRVKRDTVLSAAPLARIVELDREATAALGRRQPGMAGERISAAAALMEKAAADFPRSRSLDRTLQQKLAYLELRRGDLAALQEMVDAELATVPGERSGRMLRTEVPQELYARVMNTNPSRNAGRALPVDSVSWDDTQGFCQRLSWLLGARVRLPTELEFRSAVGESVAGGWSADTSGGHSHETGKSPPSAAGFYDLTGNLAEWLQAPAGAGETAAVAGGSYLDAASALQPLRIERMEKRERARHVGFRVVVEFPAG